MNDEFSTRMKIYEGAEAGRRLMKMLPACARLDGKNFHNFTMHMERPYDKRLSDLMIDTCMFLVRETNACMGYVQSDEITLAWLSQDYHSQIFLDGRIQKMVSVLSSMCATYFNMKYLTFFGNNADHLANFDCRVWNVPNITEGANVFLWREKDATKNSISMAARTYFSHDQVKNKNGSEMQEMLWQRGINWNDYPDFFKRGTFIQKRVRSRKFTADEIDKLPEQHEARRNPDLTIERTEHVKLDMPPFDKVANRADVIFMAAEPILQEIMDASGS